MLNDLIKSSGHLNLREDVIETLNKKDSLLLNGIMEVIINDLIKKTIFYIEHHNYIDYTLDEEKELIHKISNNRNTQQIEKFYESQKFINFHGIHNRS